MKRYSAAILVIIGLFCFSPSISRAQTNTVSDADSKGIDQMVGGYIDAFNRHDAHALSMMFTEDGDFLNPPGVADHARSGVEQSFVVRFNGVLKTAHRVYVMKNIQLLTPQMALVFANSEMSGRTAADGSIAPNAKYLYEIIAKNRMASG